MVAIADHLGVGVYSVAEAAFYARVAPALMSRWVFGSSRGRPVIDRELRDEDEKIVTFLDLVQTLAVREIRQRFQMSLQKIRDGIDAAKQKYGLAHPLAERHRIFLFHDGSGKGHGEIVIRLDRDVDGVDVGKDRHLQLTGRHKGNYVMTPIVEPFLDDLTFDKDTGLASLYAPMKDGDFTIVLDPRRRFGEPLVDPCGYTAAALWHATNTEGGIEDAARAYDVPTEAVRLANRYFDFLSPNVT